MTATWRSWSLENGGRSGTGFRDGTWHALGEPYPAAASSTGPQPTGTQAGGPAGTAARWTLCGLVADVVRKAGAFDPDHVGACRACGWWEAIRTDTIPACVARLSQSPRRALAVALVEAILAAASSQDGIEAPATVDLLSAVSAHAGEALVEAECSEGECDHPDRSTCPVVAVACPTCSVLAGAWAGKRSDCYRLEATVATPCAVLTTIAAYYRIGAGLFDHAQLAGSLTTAATGGVK